MSIPLVIWPRSGVVTHNTSDCLHMVIEMFNYNVTAESLDLPVRYPGEMSRQVLC